MRKVCLVFSIIDSFDCLNAFEHAFKEIGYETETIKIPNTWISELNRNYVHNLKRLLKEKSKTQFVIFSPQSTELFLKEADFTLIYSAYRSWFNPEKMRVIPHLWTPVRSPVSVDYLRWTRKPPLRIGFMGRFYSSSRLGNFVLNSPASLKRWLLRGAFLKYPGTIALMNELGLPVTGVNTFARIETTQILKENRTKYKSVELDIVEKQGFGASEQELNEYVSHLERSTYIVCPRGTENYSFRIYEALGRGKIPVIIDTDIVLPKEINWDHLSIRIPYESLGTLYDVILRDYELRSESDFIERQAAAFSSFAELRTMRWVKNLAKELEAAMHH
jgi:hypothetical protein